MRGIVAIIAVPLTVMVAHGFTIPQRHPRRPARVLAASPPPEVVPEAPPDDVPSSSGSRRRDGGVEEGSGFLSGGDGYEGSGVAAAAVVVPVVAPGQTRTVVTQSEYRTGLATIFAITLLFSSNSPAIKFAFSQTSQAPAPPVLLLNAAVAVVALIGLVLGAPLLGATVTESSTLKLSESAEENRAISLQAGFELGLWKSLATTINLLGLSLTSSDHGACEFLRTCRIYHLAAPSPQPFPFLCHASTSSDSAHDAHCARVSRCVPHPPFRFRFPFPVPFPLLRHASTISDAAHDARSSLGLIGVPIPGRIWTAIGLALGGVLLFTQDPSSVDSGASLTGDAVCVLAAIFYATYDLRLFSYGKRVPAVKLITYKITFQAVVSLVLATGFLAWEASQGQSSGAEYVHAAVESPQDAAAVAGVAVYCGLVVNALASVLQVGGQQAIGPARAQVIYASQPLWATGIAFLVLHETVGPEGAVGGVLFLGAMFLAATAPEPDANCEEPVCEV